MAVKYALHEIILSKEWWDKGEHEQKVFCADWMPLLHIK
jgi:hypothetical protein